jgi:Tfp pilus assembly protein PilF
LSAIAAEPDAMTHRVELARVYLNSGEVALAREQLDVALSLSAQTYLQRQDLEAARTLARSLP